MNVLVLLTMLFLHIVDDFYLQGILANMKQEQWWREHTSWTFYNHDYMIALVEHAFSWTFMMMLPVMGLIAYRKHTYAVPVFVIVFIINLALHAYIDDLKCNEYKINLITDQILHICQVVITWLVFQGVMK